MKVLIAGDFCQKNRIYDIVKQKKYNTIFSSIRPLIESSEYSIVNFEFPIILDESVAKQIVKYGPNLRGTKEAIEAVKYAGFSCCTLANNHILDQGAQCLLDTRHELESAGIDTVGAGSNLADASRVLIREINGERLSIVNVTEHEFSIAKENLPGANPLDAVSLFYQIRYAKENADFVIVITHGGSEHYQLPSPRMQDLYRYCIDVGADAVINSHQHCFSGYEIYKNKPIVYGLGNLCFDNPIKQNDKWNEGYMVVLNTQVLEKIEVIPYKQCSGSVGIELLPPSSFDNKLEELNRIISDRVKLEEKFNEFSSQFYSIWDSNLQPYKTRLFNKLYRLGLLPSFINKKKWLFYKNSVECESQRDILIKLLNTKA